MSVFGVGLFRLPKIEGSVFLVFASKLFSFKLLRYHTQARGRQRSTAVY